MTKYSCDLAIQNYLGAIFEINTTILLKSIYFAETYIEFITWFHEISVTTNLQIFQETEFVYSFLILCTVNSLKNIRSNKIGETIR